MYGCSLDKYFGNVDNNTEQVDATYFNTKVGAVALANGVLGEFNYAMNTTSLNVGLFTDELQSYGASNRTFAEIDSRTPAIEADGYQHTPGANAPGGNLHSLYSRIHKIHLQASLARRYLRKINDPTLNSLISLMYVVEGYAILGLAENFCSGIPLSHISDNNVAVYGNSLSKDSLLRISISLFDSMRVFQSNNEELARLASLGKARSLLNIGDLEGARAESQGIPIDYRYSINFTERLAPLDPAGNQGAEYLGFWTRSGTSQITEHKLATQIVAGEGSWGLDWYVDPQLSDPRLPVSTTFQNGQLHFTAPVRQQLYTTGEVAFQLANGIDAQLIESEYRLSKDQSDWIDPINNARSLVGLPDTVSPSSYSDKVSLLFRERAFWNYLRGVRLSDLRRLHNQYNIPKDRLFPSGAYTSEFPHLQYYRDVYVFIPGPAERELNNNYKSCDSFNP